MRGGHDPYLTPTGVLANRPGITDPGRLAAYEAAAVLEATVVLAAQPDIVAATWDLDHLCRLHAWLFGAVYPWAGQLRTIDITKGDTRFANAQYLNEAGTDIFTRRLDSGRRYQDLTRDQFLTASSALLAELNVLHPFRDGNGRTQRAFLQLVANDAGRLIDWSRITPEENLAASRAAVTDDDAFVTLLDRATQPLDIDPPRPPGPDFQLGL